MSGAGLARLQLRAALRSPALRLLAAALAIAVAATTATGLLADRISRALAAQSGEALGADLIAQSRRPIDPAWVEAVAATGARTTELAVLATVVFAGERSALAAVKAAGPGYPLRNVLRVADAPFAAKRAVHAPPAPGHALVDARLWAELGLAAGSRLRVGGLELVVDGVLTFEPDRGANFVDLAPRLLMHRDELTATGLLGPGSRVQYLLHVAGTPAQIRAVQALPAPEGVTLQAPEEARPALRGTLERAGEFLRLSALLAALLAAVAIVRAAMLHGRRLEPEVALLRALGAGRGRILGATAAAVLGAAIVGTLAGVALGAAIQQLLAAVLAPAAQIALPAPGPAPLLSAVGIALLLTAGCALPGVLVALRVPPQQVFRRNAPLARRSGPLIAGAVLAGAALLYWQSGGALVATLLGTGVLAVALVLALLAGALLVLLAALRRAGGGPLRRGLANLARRGAGSVAQTVVLGISLMALLLLGVVREDMLEAWRDRLPPDAPNTFLINIQPEQVAPLRAMLRQAGIAEQRIWPMARGRLVALRGQPVRAEDFDDPQTQRWMRRDINLSWTDAVGDDNRIYAGAFWEPGARGRPELSADRYAVERLSLSLGDTVTLQFADVAVEFTVTSFREVRWESLNPNFFLLTMPGVLDGRVPTSYLTSFHLPPERRSLLAELTTRFPNVTALDLEAILVQLRQTVDRVVSAVELVLLLALAAGLAVLWAAILGDRAQRRREVALLVATLGWLGLRRVLATPPLRVLAADPG